MIRCYPFYYLSFLGSFTHFLLFPYWHALVCLSVLKNLYSARFYHAYNELLIRFVGSLQVMATTMQPSLSGPNP